MLGTSRRTFNLPGTTTTDNGLRATHKTVRYDLGNLFGFGTVLLPLKPTTVSPIAFRQAQQ